MNKIVIVCNTIIALVGSIFEWLFGKSDSAIYALIAFVLIDYFTGVILSFHKKRISSEIGFKGITKKVMMFVLIALANIIDQYIIKSSSALRTMMTMFYLSNEGISIIENVGRMGVPIPKKFRDAIEKLREK